MGELFSQNVRRTSFDRMGNIGRQSIGVASEKEMDMIGLNCQPHHCPVVLACNLLKDLLQAVMYRPNQYLAPSLRTPDDMIDNQVYRMLFMLMVYTNSMNHARGWDIHPRSKETGLSAPFPVRIV